MKTAPYPPGVGQRDLGAAQTRSKITSETAPGTTGSVREPLGYVKDVDSPEAACPEYAAMYRLVCWRFVQFHSSWVL